MDHSEVPYTWEDRPKGTSWINELRSAEAISQCEKWNLQPAPTLEENRVILKNFIKSSDAPEQESRTSDAGNRERTAADTEPKLPMFVQNLHSQHV